MRFSAWTSKLEKNSIFSISRSNSTGFSVNFCSEWSENRGFPQFQIPILKKLGIQLFRVWKHRQTEKFRDFQHFQDDFCIIFLNLGSKSLKNHEFQTFFSLKSTVFRLWLAWKSQFSALKYSKVTENFQKFDFQHF